jgi:hypothetical protein
LAHAEQPAVPPAEPGLLAQAGLLWKEVRGLAEEQLRLLALEIRLAGSRFALMVGLALGAAALFATAWLGLVAAGVLWMVELGASAIGALFAAVCINIGAGLVCILMIRRESREIPFSTTLRSLFGR